jgi:hypothetical protein
MALHQYMHDFFYCRKLNPFWDSKPELFSDIACLRIPYQPCIVLSGNFFSGTPASNRCELRLHLNVVPTAAGVFKSRHILLHKYVNRIMITYLWCQIQLVIPSPASDPLNVVILTCFESMLRDRFFHELYGIVYSILLVQSVFNCRCYVLQPSWFNTISISVICQLD